MPNRNLVYSFPPGVSIKLVAALLMTLALGSCASLKQDKILPGQVRVTAENLHQLNGRYARESINDTSRVISDLFWNFFTRGYNVGEDSLCSVKIEIIDKTRMNVTLLKNDSTVRTKILEGRIRHGYFEMKRRVFIIPAIFLNVCRTTKFRMGLLENKNLTTDFREVMFGTKIIIIPFYERETQADFEYKKVGE